MFGEYGIYCNGKLIGMVSDNQLYVKPTEVGRDFVGDIVEGAPYPGAKPHLLITADRWDDRVWLSQLIRTTADALPSPKKSKTQAR